MLNSQLNGLKN